MHKIKCLFICIVLAAPSIIFASPVIWDAEVAKENALATVSFIQYAESAIKIHSQDVEKTHLQTLDRMIAAFNEQFDMKNPSITRYKFCLNALESFRPYLTVSLKSDSPGHRESMASSKKAYLSDLRKCTITSKK